MAQVKLEGGPFVFGRGKGLGGMELINQIAKDYGSSTAPRYLRSRAERASRGDTVPAMTNIFGFWGISRMEDNVELEMSKDKVKTAMHRMIRKKQAQNRIMNVRDFTENKSLCSRLNPRELDRSHLPTVVMDTKSEPAAQKPHERVYESSAAERIRILEGHLGITPPASLDLYARIKVLEERILWIEQHYPQVARHVFHYNKD